MKKFYLSDIKKEIFMPLSTSRNSWIFQLKDGLVLKKFTPFYLGVTMMLGYDLEGQISNADQLEASAGVIKPIAACYDDNEVFLGYIMPLCSGKTLNKQIHDLGKKQVLDLNYYANLYYNIEKEVRKNSEIVFPDLCNLGNIMIGSQGEIYLIDFDGMQILNYKSFVYSNSIGNCFQMPKYCSDGIWKKVIDKRSLIILYFFLVFNFDLGQIENLKNSDDYLEKWYRSINLADDDIKHNLSKMFDEKKEEDYLGKSVFRLADTYALKQNRRGVRRLVRK